MRNLGLAVVMVASLGAAPAWGKTERSASYAFDKVWPTAVRHLRVEEGYKIIEKDADVGYVVFEVSDDGKVFSGALEVVRGTDDSGRPSVRLVLRIEDRPSYMEAGVLDRMLAKMRQEHGSPPPAPEQKPSREPRPPRKRPATPES